MISKRSRRSSQPQENLRQFSLNNSKGIDGTKPITDPDTVLDMENLEINPDGSLSIRKPMLSANPAYGIKEHLMYDNEHVVTVAPDGLRICKRGSSLGTGLQVKCSTYYTYVEKVAYSADVLPRSAFDFSKASFFNAAGATIVGNCFVKAEFLITAGAVDASLYDDDISSKFLPRYVKISKESDAAVWDVSVVNPELTKLTTAEGEIPLNPNMCLDNPYAIRDGYGNAVPSVKGIVPYLKTLKDDLFTSTTESVDTGKVTPPTENDGSEEFNNAYAGDLDSGYGVFFTYAVGDKKVSCKVYSDDASVYVKLELPEGERCDVRMSCTASAVLTDGSTAGSQTKYITTYRPGVFKVCDKRIVDNVSHWQLTDYSVHLDWHSQEFAPSIRDIKVSQISESVSSAPSFKPFSTLASDATLTDVVLKAFCNLPSATSSAYYATWDYSFDGIVWNPRGAHDFSEFSKRVPVNVVSETWQPSNDITQPSPSDYVTRVYVPISAQSANDTIGANSRPDVFPLESLAYLLGGAYRNLACMFRFSIATLTQDEDGYKIAGTVSQQVFSFTEGVSTSFLETDAPNAVLGEKLYYKKSIYSYGTSDYKSIVHVSDPGSFITPMYNTIDLDAYSGDVVTAIVPWRDYLLISTEKAIYLSSKTTEGFYTKLVSSSIGVALSDRRSAVAALNGMVFKHGDAVYLAYPNLYASDDTVLILTDISKPISHILGTVESSEPSFAIYHDDKYVLMLPDETSTRCLIYDTSEKRWSNFTYPVKLYDFFSYSKDGVSTRTAVGENFEYFIFDAPAGQGVDTTAGRYADVSGSVVIPIHFMLDTGQKTDSISHTRQFVESKLMFATLSEEDAFPFTMFVAIDGDSHITRKDVSTDAPFWKTSDRQSKGVLGTAFRLGSDNTPATGAFNTLRQLIVRYSGKGKSIRHVIEGDSLCNFKLYETYVRYKNLNVKQ